MISPQQSEMFACIGEVYLTLPFSEELFNEECSLLRIFMQKIIKT